MKPVLRTRENRAAQAAVRWREQYMSRDGVSRIPSDKAPIHAALVALGTAPKPDDVDRAIGNESWTDPGQCDGCNSTDRGPRVQVGDEPDYESSTAVLCQRCVEEALALLHKGEDG